MAADKRKDTLSSRISRSGFWTRNSRSTLPRLTSCSGKAAVRVQEALAAAKRSRRSAGGRALTVFGDLQKASFKRAIQQIVRHLVRQTPEMDVIDNL